MAELEPNRIVKDRNWQRAAVKKAVDVAGNLSTLGASVNGPVWFDVQAVSCSLQVLTIQGGVLEIKAHGDDQKDPVVWFVRAPLWLLNDAVKDRVYAMASSA